MNVNATIRDKSILNAHYLERYKDGEVWRIIKLLYGCDDEIKALLIKRGVDGSWTTSRLNALLEDIGSLNSEAQTALEKAFKNDAAGLSDTVAKREADIINRAGPLKFDLAAPSAAQVWAAANAQPFDGYLLKDALGGIYDARQVAVERAVRRGVVEGKSNQDILTSIFGHKAENYQDGVLSRTYRNDVTPVVQTATAHIANSARLSFFQENDDIVSDVQIVATLDPLTCEVCMAEDGKVYALDSGHLPPFHYNCRCTIVPVIKTWQELGVKVPPGMRASYNGEVSDTETYASWLGKQSADVQKEALGAERYKLYKSGAAIDKFSSDGRILTLDELKAKE